MNAQQREGHESDRDWATKITQILFEARNSPMTAPGPFRGMPLVGAFVDEIPLIPAEYLRAQSISIGTLADSSAETDQRIEAWMAVADHPVLRPAYNDGDALLPAVLRRLTQLQEIEAAVNELTKTVDPPITVGLDGAERFILNDLKTRIGQERADGAEVLSFIITSRAPGTDTVDQYAAQLKDGSRYEYDSSQLLKGKGTPLVIEPEVHEYNRTIRHLGDQVDALTLALIHTVEYVGVQTLPPLDGWSWYDVIKTLHPDVAARFRATWDATGAPYRPEPSVNVYNFDHNRVATYQTGPTEPQGTP